MVISMNIYNNIEDINCKNKCAVALGSFDGIHLGHRSVIENACKSPLEASVFTFQKSPSELLGGRAEYLMTDWDKRDTLAEMGVRNLFSVDFSSVKDMAPETFFTEILLKRCNAGLISCGINFRFGKGASGNTELLKVLCGEHGIRLIVSDYVLSDSRIISSTAIRETLKAGDAAKAAKMLGRPFGFTLPVGEGNRIGRTLGTPTINQELPAGFVRPMYGVYASIVTVDGRRHWGVTNIGVKPTVGKYEPLAETWIGEFDGNLYGQKIKLELLEFIRPEKKFNSLAELKSEIYKNAEIAQKLAEKYLECKNNPLHTGNGVLKY